MAHDVATPTKADDDYAYPSPAVETLVRQPGHTARPRWLPATLVLALATLAPVAAQKGSGSVAHLMLAGLAGLTLLFAILGHTAVARLSVALTAIAASGVLPWTMSWWPIPAVVGLCIYFVAHARACRGPVPPQPILRWGRFGAVEALSVVGLALVSAAALLVFSAFAPAPISTVGYLLTVLTPEWLLAAGVAFAVLNAFVEEVLFRGVILQHLRHVLPTGLAVILQAVAFGLLHLNGYPYGPVGVVLAAVYGLLLGILRVRTSGLVACWLAHVCADLVIFALLVHAAS